MKRVFVDTETTGLDKKIHGVIQIAALVEINGKVVEKFEGKCAPLEDDKVDLGAIKVAGYQTEEEVRSLPPSTQLYSDFVNLLARYVDRFDKYDKFHWYGYNANFDFEFVWSWFFKHGDNTFRAFVWTPPICILNLAGFVLETERPRLSSYTQMSIARHLQIGVEGDRIHDALYDIEVSRNILLELERRLKNKYGLEASLNR